MANRGEAHPWTKDEIIADLQRQNLELRRARDKELLVIKALWERAASFWPPAVPFDEKDVVVVFRSEEDANEFSEALALFGQIEE